MSDQTPSPMDPERLAMLRAEYEAGAVESYQVGSNEDGPDFDDLLGELLADRDHWEAEAKRWRARCDVTSRDIVEAGITRAKCEAWLEADGWALGSHPENEYRVWEKQGCDRVNLSPDTESWPTCLATGIAVTISIRADERGRPAWDILEEMAALPMDGGS